MYRRGPAINRVLYPLKSLIYTKLLKFVNIQPQHVPLPLSWDSSQVHACLPQSRRTSDATGERLLTGFLPATTASHCALSLILSQSLYAALGFSTPGDFRDPKEQGAAGTGGKTGQEQRDLNSKLGTERERHTVGPPPKPPEQPQPQRHIACAQ